MSTYRMHIIAEARIGQYFITIERLGNSSFRVSEGRSTLMSSKFALYTSDYLEDAYMHFEQAVADEKERFLAENFETDCTVEETPGLREFNHANRGLRSGS